MAKPEQSFWRTAREKLTPYGHFTRIENDGGAGQPDVHFAVEGRTGWLELKVWPNGLLPSQRIWAGEYIRCGGWVRVLVSVRLAGRQDVFLLPVGVYDLVQAKNASEGLPGASAWILSRDGWPRLVELLGR